ncbi:MAG: nitrogen fixation protein NifH, partial [Ktedonobacteraceae bacterium]
MATWINMLKDDPLPWLLEEDTPAVRHLALRQLLDQPENAPDVRHASAAAMQTDPIASILAAQHPDGFWVKPGPGYAPKYRGTVWQVIFLDQLGADGRDKRVHAACEYVLSHSQAETGGFAASGSEKVPPPPSGVIHCLNGNLLRALLGFGWLEDENVQHAIDWEAGAITGEGATRYYQSGTSGPGFCCAANERLPCAWGAIKGLLALARIPPERRAPHVERAIQQGVAFLLSCDPASAAYPAGYGNVKPSQSWFKLGFPSGYVADVLQNLTVLCELGFAKDVRLQPSIEWLLGKQDQAGRWRNQYAYHGKTWVDFERQG